MVLPSSLELLFIVVFGSFLEMYSGSCPCNKPSGCLQIFKKDEKTLLSCRTSSLDNSVEFLDPSGKYHRSCSASVHGHRRNCSKHVTQDKISNVTTLTLNNPFDTSNFGKWKCVQGPNHVYDTSTVNPNIFLRSKSDSDVTSITSDFFGQALKIGKGFFFQFTCKLFQIPVDKSLMFLVNERTVDILRFEKMNCYNIKGKCTESSCSCSLSNKTFQWFYSLSTHVKNWNFEVQARYANKSTGKIVNLSWSRTFQTEDFGILKLRTVTIRPGTNKTGWTDYKKLDIDMSNMNYQTVPKGILVIIVALSLTAVSLIVIICRRLKNKEMEAKSNNRLTKNPYEVSLPKRKTKEQYYLFKNCDMKMDPDLKGGIFEDICRICKMHPVIMFCCDCLLFQCLMCCQGHMRNNKNHSYVKILGRNEIPVVCNNCRSKGTQFACSLCKKLFCISCCSNHYIHKDFIYELE